MTSSTTGGSGGAESDVVGGSEGNGSGGPGDMEDLCKSTEKNVSTDATVADAATARKSECNRGSEGGVEKDEKCKIANSDVEMQEDRECMLDKISIPRVRGNVHVGEKRERDEKVGNTQAQSFNSKRARYTSTFNSDTIFFPSLPISLRSTHALKRALPSGAISVRLSAAATAGNTGPAWARYGDPARARNVLTVLHRDDKRLGLFRARLHAPSAGIGAGTSDGNGSINPQIGFHARADMVRKRGGLGDTLLIRNAPMELRLKELEEVLEGIGKKCTPVRMRDAKTKNGNAKHFWLVYMDLNAAKCAYECMFGQKVQLRCGMRFTITPTLHDDSTDSESRTRRNREIAKTPQKSNAQILAEALQGNANGYSAQFANTTAATSRCEDIERLQTLLRQTPRLCWFLRDENGTR